MNEENTANIKSNGLLKTGNFYLVGILVSLGQWGDAKALVTDVYHDVVTHFTHDIEYNNLKKVQVGSNLSFIENTFGLAKLIKAPHKESTKGIEYRYYSDPKFILSIAAKGDRVTAFSILSLDSSFYPQLHFSESNLGKNKFNELQDFSGTFNTDAGNIIYYQELTSLGVNGLFLNRYLSFVGYGAHYGVNQESTEVQENSIQQLNKLILLEEDEDIKEQVEALRQITYPNVVTFGEIDGELAADMLLTRNEYLAHFWES